MNKSLFKIKLIQHGIVRAPGTVVQQCGESLLLQDAMPWLMDLKATKVREGVSIDAAAP